jgi:hypothetical protein
LGANGGVVGRRNPGDNKLYAAKR